MIIKLRENFQAERVYGINNLEKIDSINNSHSSDNVVTFYTSTDTQYAKSLIICNAKKLILNILKEEPGFENIIILKSEISFLSFENIDIKKLIIQDCVIDEIIIKSGTISKLIIGNNNIQNFIFSGGSLNYGILFSELSNDSNYEYILENDSDRQHLKIIGDYLLDNDSSLYGYFGYLDVKNKISKSVKNITINHNEIDGGFLRILYLDCENILLQGNSKKLRVSISQIYISTILVNGYTSDGGRFNLKYLHLKKGMQPKLSILASNLEKCIFEKCNFERFEIIIEDSVLRNMIVKDIKWPLINQFKSMRQVHSEKNRDKKTIYSLDKREMFLELKMLGRNNGNSEMELKFKRFELIEFSKFNQNIGDRIMLLLSQTNNYGTNWIKPLFLFLFIVYIIYYSSLYFTNSTLDFYSFYNSVHLFNPTHNTEQLFTNHTEYPILKVVDLFIKLISSFFIFQTIFAFRKYSKF